MLHCLANPVQVVNANVAHAGRPYPHVREDQGYLSQLQVFQKTLFHAERHDGDALNATLDHPPHCVLHAFRVVSGGGQKDFVMILYRNALKDLNDFRKKWIRDFRNNEAEDAALSRYQSARLGVRKVAEFFDDLPDSLGQERVDGRDAVDRPRHGSSRDLCPFCDLANIHRLRAPRPLRGARANYFSVENLYSVVVW